MPTPEEIEEAENAELRRVITAIGSGIPQDTGAKTIVDALVLLLVTFSRQAIRSDTAPPDIAALDTYVDRRIYHARQANQQAAEVRRAFAAMGMPSSLRPR